MSTPWVGLASAAIFASTPLVYWTGGSAYTDLWSVLFATAALAGLACFAERPNRRLAFVTGLLAGTAGGFKLTIMVVALPVVVALSLIGGLSFPRLKARLGLLGTFTLGAAVAGSFWYGRAWVLTGNPVFPMLNAVFKSPYWPAENTRFNMGLFGIGTSLWDLVRLPWNLSLHPNRFVEDGSIGLIYLLVLPFALWAIARRRIAPWTWGVLLAGGLLWFFNAQYLRYLLPLLPLAAIIGSAGLLGKATPGSTAFRTGLVLAATVMVTAATWVTSGSPSFPIAVVRGEVTRADYTSQYVAGFRVAQYVRRILPASARIYGVGEDMTFYYDRYFVPSSWLGHISNPSLPQGILGARTGSEAQRLLTRAGFTHLVLQRNHPWVTRWRRPDGWLASEVFWAEEGPRIEYAYLEFYLFRLVPGSTDVPTRRGPELLQNPGLERGSGPVPRGWDIQGSVNVATSDDGAGGREIRARASPGSYLVQRVVVKPDRLYGLEAEIRSIGASSTVRLSIQWFDGGDKALDYRTFRQVVAGSEWRRYAMACTAPAAARSALIWLTAAEGSDVEFSQAAFRELR